MPSQVQKTPRAAADLIDIAAFIAEDNPDAAERFLDAAETAFALLAPMPSIGRAVTFQSPAAQGMRVWRFQGFERYLIFYRAIPHGIEIVRVLHGSRDIEGLFADD
jgi:toxin ParE1/3/4